MLVKQTLFLFLSRIIFIWIFIYILVLLTGSSHGLAIVVSFLFTIIFELFALRGRYEKFVLPKHQKNLELVREEAKNLLKYSNKQIINFIEKTTQKSAWSIINIGYLALPSWGWEIVFKIFFPLLTKKTTILYQDLLIGFANKTTESNMALWEVSRISDPMQKKTELNKYLDNHGSRAEDLDLRHKTLRERPRAIEGLTKLYEKIESPQNRLNRAKEKRVEAENNIIVNLRVPKWFFHKILSITQKNVSLREDRRFYEFEFDYYIRAALLSLADRLQIPTDDIFNKSWDNIKYESNQRNIGK